MKEQKIILEKLKKEEFEKRLIKREEQKRILKEVERRCGGWKKIKTFTKRKKVSRRI